MKQWDHTAHACQSHINEKIRILRSQTKMAILLMTKTTLR